MTTRPEEDTLPPLLSDAWIERIYDTAVPGGFQTMAHMIAFARAIEAAARKAALEEAARFAEGRLGDDENGVVDGLRHLAAQVQP